MKYLTRSYVRALRLPRFPVWTDLPTAVFTSVRFDMPVAADAVEYDGQIYVQEADGLSYARCDRKPPHGA